MCVKIIVPNSWRDLFKARCTRLSRIRLRHKSPRRFAGFQIGIQFDTNSGDKEVSTRRKKETGKRVSPFNLAGVFIRSSFSSYITHSVRVRKISLRSAVEIGKISLAEVSRRRCRRNGDDAGEVGGFLGNRCARRHRGNFLIWNFRKPRLCPRGRRKFSEGGSVLRCDAILGNDDTE